MPGKGIRFVIEENKKLAKVDREISVNQVTDFSILNSGTEGAWNQRAITGQYPQESQCRKLSKISLNDPSRASVR